MSRNYVHNENISWNVTEMSRNVTIWNLYLKKCINKTKKMKDMRSVISVSILCWKKISEQEIEIETRGVKWSGIKEDEWHFRDIS